MTVYKAKLDGFDLDLKPEKRDIIDINIVKYDLPFSQGAHLDNFGIKGRSARVTSVFYNDTYEMHFAFLEHLKLPQDKTLVHPVYGLIKGQVSSPDILHDERNNYVEIAFEITENVDANAKPSYEPSLVPAVEDAVVNSQLKQMEQMAADVKKFLGPLASSVLSISLDPGSGILGQIGGISGTARTFISSLDSAVTVLESALENISNPADSILTTIDYATDIPGRLIGALSKTVERYSSALVAANPSPASYISSLRSSMSILSGSIEPLKTHLKVAIAQIEPLAVSSMLVTDENSREVLRKVENSKVWSSEGKMIYKPEIPNVLTVSQLEQTLVMVREDIQAAITALRVEFGSPALIQSLKSIAVLMSNYVNKIKLEREKIIDFEIDNPKPLHLICLQNNLPYMYAERICSINKIFNPTFCDGTVKVYAR